MSSIDAPARAGRQHYLDWIRVGAFALLILYHVGMFYVSWDWHVKSSYAGRALEPLMYATNPWRLTLLFMVSGVATRFMSDKLSPGALARGRSVRLLVPLAFGMLIVVPPQPYLEVVEKVAYSGSFADFYRLYLSGYGGFCKDGECLIIPTWNHLWFLPYLAAYTLIVAAFSAWRPGWPSAAERLLVPLLRGPGLVLWPILYLGLMRLLLMPQFEVTHALIDDWYNHSVSLAAFLLGFTALRSEAVIQGLAAKRWLFLALAVISWASYAGYAWLYHVEGAAPSELLQAAMRFVYAINQWTAIAAIFGFGSIHLNRTGRGIRYFTDAVFPFYIVHQTLIVVVGHELAKPRLPVALESGGLFAATILGCFTTYEIVRRVPLLRPLFGLKRLDPYPKTDERAVTETARSHAAAGQEQVQISRHDGQSGAAELQARTTKPDRALPKA